LTAPNGRRTSGLLTGTAAVWRQKGERPLILAD